MLIPADPLVSVAVPSTEVPSRNVTDPVGAPTPLVTVAVTLTVAPIPDGLGLDAIATAVGAGFTTSVNVPLALAATSTVPLYDAVSAWEPTARLERLTVAVPLLSDAVAMRAPPSRNTTVPVGTPTPDVTVAVYVMVVPNVVGFALAVNAVVLDAGLTTWVSGELVLGANVPLPAYAAESVWEPPPSVETLRVATPLVTVAEPSEFAPSVNVTVPVGVPAAELTVPVMTTADPFTEGFGLALTTVEVGAKLTT